MLQRVDSSAYGEAKMKILIFTAKDIGLNCINFLLEHFSEDEYTFVVCEPEADRIIYELHGKGCCAAKLDENVLDEIRGKAKKHYDWLLNLWGGYIFKEDILSKVGQSLNIHPAFLPYCRGRDPVVWALRYGFPAGVTLHVVSSGVDEGAIWYREKVHYDFPCTGGELYKAVTDRSWKAFCENWPKIRGNQIPPESQPPEGAGKTFRRSDLCVDRRINADEDSVARSVVQRLMAHDFGDGYQAELVMNGKVYAAHLCLELKQEDEKQPVGAAQANICCEE